MKPPNLRLSPDTLEEFARLQAESNEFAALQNFLNKLPMRMQVEDLDAAALDRLRSIARDPKALLSGPHLLAWNRMTRRHQGLNRKTI